MIGIRGKKIDDELAKLIVTTYNEGDKSFNEVAKLCNINNVSVKTVLLREGVRLHDKSKFYRKYSFNENYFENVDSEDKAYFLGLIVADGCVYRNRLIISLQEGDRHILEKFKECTEFTGNLRKVPPNKNTNNKIQYSITLVSNKLINDLLNLGITVRKSLTVLFPIISEHLHSHFIRGYFDGDGSIYIDPRRNNGRICFIGSIDFIEYLQKIVLKQLPSLPKNISIVNSGKNATLNFSSKESILFFYKYFYDNGNIYLYRKYEMFNKIIEIYSNKKQFYGGEKINQLTANKELIKTWDNIDAIPLFSLHSRQTILRCISGKIKTAAGFIWTI